MKREETPFLLGRDTMPTCFFIGHREALDSLLPQLSAAVEHHITELGVTDFVVGSYGWFDSMAARMVTGTMDRTMASTSNLAMNCFFIVTFLLRQVL